MDYNSIRVSLLYYHHYQGGFKMTSKVTSTSRDWINAIDFKKDDEEDKKITIFPLQFANCDRLRKHDAVYIFDEVGSGKTITSGLMVLDYLEDLKRMDSTRKPKVLVVTINALKKSGDNNIVCAPGANKI